MGKFRKLISALALPILSLALVALPSCTNDGDDLGSASAVVNSFSPTGSAVSGLAIGDSFTITGSGLGNVSYVTVGGHVADQTLVSGSELTVEVPMGAYTNSITASGYTGVRYEEVVKVFNELNEEVWRSTNNAAKPYIYIDVPFTTPVGAVTPLAGTVGDEVEVTGYNLDEVSSISFDGETVNGADFTSQSENSILFNIPAASASTYAQGNSYVAVALNFEAGSYVAESRFVMQTPYPYPTEVMTELSGEELTMEGENLDLIDMVEFSGKECTILTQTATSLTFAIPYTSDYDVAPDANSIVTDDVVCYYGAAAAPQQMLVWEDFALKAIAPEPVVSTQNIEKGTLGDLVTMTGFYFDLVSSIDFGTANLVYAADGGSLFIKQTATELQFYVPNTLTSGAAEIKLNYVYEEVDLNVVVDTDFEVCVPKFTTAPTTAEANVPMTVEGENLDYIESLEFSMVDCVITDQSATSITFYMPGDGAYDETETDGKITDKIIARVGELVDDEDKLLPVEMASGVALNMATAGSASVTAVTVANQANPTEMSYMGIYLNGQFTLTGVNLTTVTEIKVGEYAATIDTQSATEIVATLSDEYNFTTATTVDLVVSAGSTPITMTGAMRVYPFYYYTDLTLIGRNAAKTNMFVDLETGIVHSTDDFRAFDPFGAASVKAANAEEYNSVSPYFIYQTASDCAGFYGAHNTKSGLKNYKDSEGVSVAPESANASVGGTPVVKFDPLDFASSTDKAFVDAVLGKTIETQAMYDQSTGTSAPKMGYDLESFIGVEGDTAFGAKVHGTGVAGVGYYDFAGEYYKKGFIIVKSLSPLTYFDYSSKANVYKDGDDESTVTFDLLWPKGTYADAKAALAD